MPGSPATGGDGADWGSALTPGLITGFGGAGVDQGSGGLTTGLAAAVNASTGAAPLWSPDNPLFWFGAILLAAVGAITISTSVDLGPLKGKARV